MVQGPGSRVKSEDCESVFFGYIVETKILTGFLECVIVARVMVSA